MISTFPALTNYAWSVILNTGQVEGYQTKYYNPDLNRIEGGFQDLFKSKGFPNKFDYIQENMLSQLQAYIFGHSGIRKRMKNLGKKLLSSNRPRLFFAFIGVSDIIAHMKGEPGLLKFLDTVDRELIRIRKEHLEKFGEPLEVTMVSDHANTLEHGKVINVYRFLRENDFFPSKKLKNPDDVIYHTAGILSVAPFYIQEPRKMELARALAAQPWAELVVTTDKNLDNYIILSETGTLVFAFSRENETFKILKINRKDPTGLTQKGLALGKWIPQSEVFQASWTTPYPDCLKRILMALNGELVRYPASVLVSFKYGYESGSDRLMNLLSGLKKSRHGTHGGLAALDSIGFISSTRQTFPGWVSAYQVHNQIQGTRFALKYEAMTFIWDEGGACKMRLGQSLLEKPEAVSLRFRLKTLANKKYTLSKKCHLFSVGLKASDRKKSQPLQSRFMDINLPCTINSGYIYQLQAQVLDNQDKIIAQTKTKPFQINHIRGYIRIPLQTFFNPPKQNNRK
jgi:hypothetical protein